MGLFSFIGNIFKSRNERKINDANIAAQDRVNMMNAEQFDRSMDLAWDQLNFGKRAYDLDRWDALNATDRNLRQAMNFADESGIHRLALLGAGSGGYSSPSFTGTGIPSGGNQQAPLQSGASGALLGDAIGEGLSEMYATISGERKKKEATAKKYTDSQTRLNNAEAALMEAQSRSVIQGARRAEIGGPGMAQQTNGDPMPLYVRVVDPRTKQTGWMLNPDLGDIEQGGLLAAWHALNPYGDPAPEESKYPRARSGSVRPKSRGDRIIMTKLPPAKHQPGY